MNVPTHLGSKGVFLLFRDIVGVLCGSLHGHESCLQTRVGIVLRVVVLQNSLLGEE